MFEHLDISYDPVIDTHDPMDNMSNYLNLKGSVKSGI
jgi:hypothetical protein